MSYTRVRESGHYIFPGGDYVDFNGVTIPDDEVDVFIYKLFNICGGNELRERYDHGSRVIDNHLRGILIQKLWKHAPDDLEMHTAAIAAFSGEIWREYYTPIIGAAQVDYMLAKFQFAEQITMDIKENDYTYFTAYSAKDVKQDRLIGCCGVVPEEDSLMISKLYAHRDYRGNVVARSFVDEVIALCRYNYKFNKIRLIVDKRDEAAIAADQEMGFVTVDSAKIDIGGGFFMDNYIMEFCVGAVNMQTQNSQDVKLGGE